MQGSSFMDRLARGWALTKMSWAVLRLDKELILFPIISGLACLVVSASFVLPLLLSPDLPIVHPELREALTGSTLPRSGAARPEWMEALPFVYGFLFYLVSYIVIVFFNTALVCCALKRFSGGDPDLAYGMRAATARLPQILAWAFLAATVSYILSELEKRASFVGAIVLSIVGVAWSVVTFLVVPVLAAEGLGPIGAVKRSASLLRASWGESVGANLSMSIIGVLAAIPGVIVLIGAFIILGATDSLVVAAPLALVGLVYLLALWIATTTLQEIVLAGVYVYAATGQTPGGFTEASVKDAFVAKPAA